jgi:hypothetical protein
MCKCKMVRTIHHNLNLISGEPVALCENLSIQMYELGHICFYFSEYIRASAVIQYKSIN